LTTRTSFDQAKKQLKEIALGWSIFDHFGNFCYRGQNFKIIVTNLNHYTFYWDIIYHGLVLILLMLTKNPLKLWAKI
jgi:hypothetical protein